MYKIVVPAYGKAREWSPRLKKFLALLREHNPDADVMVISDGESNWTEEELHGCERLEIPESNDHTTFSNLNMSGILLAYAAIRLNPCLVMTLDCEVRRKIQWVEWVGFDIAFGKDPAERFRKIKGISFEEYNVAVAWFGSEFPGYAFLQAWDLHGRLGRAVCPFWEQVVWSFVYKQWADESKTLYPNEMNWSHWWLNEPGNPIIVHHHGNSGKRSFDGLMA